MRKRIDCLGMTFGYWCVESPAQSSPQGLSMWNCICKCGTTKILAGCLLSSGKTKSCGCERANLIRDAAITHGKTRTREFETWSRIKYRCHNSKSKDFLNYGGRGIYVCNEWLTSFENFLNDMGVRPEGMSIERKDNNKGYSKENCIWATTKDQNKNKRNVVFFDGKCQSEWASELGISVQAVAYRMKKFNSPLGIKNGN